MTNSFTCLKGNIASKSPTYSTIACSIKALRREVGKVQMLLAHLRVALESKRTAIKMANGMLIISFVFDMDINENWIYNIV